MRARMDDSRPIWQTIGIFLIPLMLSNILQSLSATVNSIYIGRVIGVSALAAISAFFPLLFFIGLPLAVVDHPPAVPGFGDEGAGVGIAGLRHGHGRR